MPSREEKKHDKVVRILYELCREYETKAGIKFYSRIFPDHISNTYKPITLSALAGRKPISKTYYPDIWAQVKASGKIDIFEVWHTETEAEAVCDLLLSLLTNNIRYVHIVCTGVGVTDEKALELKTFILNRVFNDEGHKLIYPNDVLIANLSEIGLRDDSKVKKYLRGALEFS